MPLIALLLAAAAANSEPPATNAAPLTETEREAVEHTDEVRLSLPTEEDHDAWTQPGLHILLGLSGAKFFGFGPAPTFTSIGAALQLRVRLSALWSIAGTFQYEPTRGVSTGLAWSATVEPIFHPLRALGIGVGLGYGGLTADDGVRATGATETVSRTVGNAETLHQCTSGGVSGLARADYLFVAGPLFASGPYVEARGLWTRCADSGRKDQETGLPVTLSQWWLQRGFAVGWWVAWR